MSFVVKRDGRREGVSFDKILRRVTSLCAHPWPLRSVDAVRVARDVVQGVHDGVLTERLDVLAAETAASLATHHPQYSYLAARISVSNLHKKTSPHLSVFGEYLQPSIVAFVEAHRDALASAIVWDRDYDYDYFGFKTLERSYLHRRDGVIVERPQLMLLRVALGVHSGDLPRVLETYELLSRHAFTMATPCMFNAGTPAAHLASCYLLPVEDDSIYGIYETQKKCALISKSAGGIGLSVSNVRAKGSRIASTGGASNGIVPMLRCYEATARHVDQGGGKRKGAFAAYLEPWHRDVLVFLDLKKNHGAEELRARDLFYALWVPDLFMRRVEANAEWSLFCPSDCVDLVDLCGEAFDAAYEAYEADGGVPRETIAAQKLWFRILDAQIETGTPYMLYKDACNAKSNQSHLGTIRSSNLCAEIVQFSSADEIAVCNLASVALPFFVDGDRFDHAELKRVVAIVTRNLNRTIDVNAYAREEAERSNKRHRPIGIGVQGLADVFCMLGMAYDSDEAVQFNAAIFESIYYAALSASCDLAREHGAPYETFEGSHAAGGRLQFDLWNVSREGRCEWDELKERIRTHGLRNSLLVALMPTASTAQILGNNECFEPFTSNIYVRRVLAGEFALVNRHLVAVLEKEGLWTEAVRQSIIAANGSVQHIAAIPERVRRVFRTAWEMPMRRIVDMSIARAPFVDQSQSLNIFFKEPSHEKLSAMHFYGWRAGLKTGMYYLRTRPASDPVKVTVPVECESCSA